MMGVKWSVCVCTTMERQERALEPVGLCEL